MFSDISLSLITVVFILLNGQTIAAEGERRSVTNVVLIGATGDLAKRYLWQGFFELFVHEKTEESNFRFHAAARVDSGLGTKKIEAILEASLKCDDFDSAASCEKWKKSFTSVTRYHSLKNDEDYKLLCDGITANVGLETAEQGRIFYLSVPPFTYDKIAKNIDLFCRPANKETWLRVVFEKPFGSDVKSALELSATLSNYFEENEIYRIDHYLGKIGVMQILEFRSQNEHLYRKLWNSDHIERIEIVLKETSDCQGRTNFYDKYGVIRDVMQNHMTELLAMVAMEMPNSLNNSRNILQNKLRFLKEIKNSNRWSAVIGQYRDYNKHLQEDDLAYATGPDSKEISTTPTFAAVSMFVNNRRWNGVPFVLVSGKQLDERVAYVRIIFKNNIYTVVSSNIFQNQCRIRQIVFNIQGGKVNKPAILISGSLPRPNTFTRLSTVDNDVENFGCMENKFYSFTPNVSSDAYTVLISAVYHEQRNLFVGTKDLIASWQVWSPLINSLDSVVPRPYDRDHLNTLYFIIAGERVEFVEDDSQGSNSNYCDIAGSCKPQEESEGHYNLRMFRGYPLITGEELHVVRTLADHILQHAISAVSLKGVFHLALSGGTSPRRLYETLAFETMEFPWQHTHIWMVDERCSHMDSKESNFGLVYTSLLQHVPIPLFNLHPMHVSLGKGLCHPTDHGSQHYEAELQRVLGGNTLDFVVLGVGTDGHTASLFPQQDILKETEKWISLAQRKQNSETRDRMTMTFVALNKAKHVAVLVLGEQKQDMVRKISVAGTDVWNYPVNGIQPENGDMVWFIDSKAL